MFNTTMFACLQHRVPRLFNAPKRLISCTATLQNSDNPKKKEWDLNNPEEKALYKFYRPERITPNKRGVELLKTPGLNKVGWFLNLVLIPTFYREWRFLYTNDSTLEFTDCCPRLL